MWTCVGVLFLAACVAAITRDQFYPYGPGLDLKLPRSPEVSSPEIPLQVPVRFYGETYESIFVNKYGVLSFRADIPSFLNSEFPLPYPSIAAFYANIDTSQTGEVYYRETNDLHVISKAAESVQSNFVDYFDYRPLQVFVATWINVTHSSSERIDRKNSFQAAIISNGTESFVELLYPEGEIQWIQKESQPGSIPDAKAQAGFIAEDGRVYSLRGSGSHQIRNIISWSNVHEPGKYVFRVGDIGPEGNIVDPDLYNQYEIEASEEYNTCAQSGPSICHFQARCVDYQSGICCQCNEGFYGNGKSCIKNDVPLRAHGKLNGEINNIPLNNVDIQAYIVVADGRSYTALSQAPLNLGGSLQLLNVLGSVIGWLFAKPIGSARNGYQLTGSSFNYTADIFFPASGDRVSISQEYLGHDVFDQITLDAEVRGTVPYVEPSAKLEVLENEEQYTTNELGLIQSQSNRTFINKKTGEKFQLIVSQKISYNPCRYEPQTDDINLPSTFKITKTLIGYDIRDNILRYGMSMKVTQFGEEDPCVQGRDSCGHHSSCIVQGSSFTCVCQTGYTTTYQGDTTVCIDIDECIAETHNCDRNADCLNHEGGFRCQCRGGFAGDGVSCEAISSCRNKQCDPNAHCIDNNGDATCICNPGFILKGEICINLNELSCKNCSPYAECQFTTSNEYKCQCKQGYTGDGYYCVETEVRTTTSSPYSILETEYNETFVLPNCDSYECVCPEGYSSFVDNMRNNLCRLVTTEVENISHNSSANICSHDMDCPPNALCSPITYECVCLNGYEGNGYECIESSPICSCGSNAHCIENAAGEQICVCDPSYHGDGYTCRPNFSCINDSDCEYNAECRPDPTTREYICQCIDGYRKDQNDACILDGTLCNGALCAEHASCLYDGILGVNYCHCDAGYEGEGIDKCVPQGHSCDVADDCSADAVCTLNEYAYECVCKEGFIGDGYICTPERNCRNDPYMCDTHASCLKRSGGFYCECNAGYVGNGSSCHLNPRQQGNFLVASDGTFIYRVPFQMSAREYATPINTIVDQVAVAIGVDCPTGTVYWSDIVSSTIKRSAYDGSDFNIFLTNDIKSPEGISIDWSARNIFWTDAKKHTIEVANLDTKLRKVLFSNEGIINPRGIAVHPQRGKIFWSDWNRQAPKIEWANMDGSERGQFLGAPDVQLPNSLTIDWSRDQLCYADAGLKSIECVDIDTKRRETIATGCSYPFGLAINKNRYYWSDWRTSRIEFIDAQTHDKGHLPISTSSKKLFGVATAPDQCARSDNICQYRNGNCNFEELCLPDGRGGRTCSPGV